MKYEFYINLIDVCLPDYLCNHCNGEDEVLLSIPVRNNTTIASAKAMLQDELNSLCDERIPEELTDEKFCDLLDEFMPNDSVRVAKDWSKALQYIDLAEEDENDDGEECYAYFRLQFEEDESEEDESEEESAFIPLCENCSANIIQGILCHEHGCPSAPSTFQRQEGGF